MENLHTDDDRIKAVFANPTVVLAAAYDANDTALTAAAIVAHPRSTWLIERRSVKRMFDIAYKQALPSRTDHAFIRAVGLFILLTQQVRA